MVLRCSKEDHTKAGGTCGDARSRDAGRAKGPRHFKGVRMRSWGKWVTEIRQPNSHVRVWLGSYETAVQAARAYDIGLRCLRGPQVRGSYNFPDEPMPEGASDGLSHRQIQELVSKAATRPVYTSDMPIGNAHFPDTTKCVGTKAASTGNTTTSSSRGDNTSPNTSSTEGEVAFVCSSSTISSEVPLKSGNTRAKSSSAASLISRDSEVLHTLSPSTGSEVSSSSSPSPFFKATPNDNSSSTYSLSSSTTLLDHEKYLKDPHDYTWEYCHLMLYDEDHIEIPNSNMECDQHNYKPCSMANLFLLHDQYSLEEEEEEEVEEFCNSSDPYALLIDWLW